MIFFKIVREKSYLNKFSKVFVVGVHHCANWLQRSVVASFIARRAIVFATYTGVPDKKCVNLCLMSVCPMSDVTLQDCRFFARL